MIPSAQNPDFDCKSGPFPDHFSQKRPDHCSGGTDLVSLDDINTDNVAMATSMLGFEGAG